MEEGLKAIASSPYMIRGRSFVVKALMVNEGSPQRYTFLSLDDRGGGFGLCGLGLGS